MMSGNLRIDTNGFTVSRVKEYEVKAEDLNKGDIIEIKGSRGKVTEWRKDDTSSNYCDIRIDFDNNGLAFYRTPVDAVIDDIRIIEKTKEKEETMEKKDLRKMLKPGDVVTLRNGATKVLDNCEDFEALSDIKNDLVDIDDLDKNLNFTGICWETNSHDNDIVKIDRTVATYTIWKRKEEPILDSTERNYLSAVIRPFRNDVKSIVKENNYYDGSEYICINYKKEATDTLLPDFKAGTMYKGMKLNKPYTLEELGL